MMNDRTLEQYLILSAVRTLQMVNRDELLQLMKQYKSSSDNAQLAIARAALALLDAANADYSAPTHKCSFCDKLCMSGNKGLCCDDPLTCTETKNINWMNYEAFYLNQATASPEKSLGISNISNEDAE